MKMWPANWDNELAINPYQDTSKGNSVAFAAVIKLYISVIWTLQLQTSTLTYDTCEVGKHIQFVRK